MSIRLLRFVSVSLLFIIVVSSCNFTLPSAVQPTPTVTPIPPGTVSPEATPTQAVDENRTLTVCLGQEPNTLYPFGTLNSAARSVLGAVYDGPADTFTNGYQPVILEKIPSIENGDAQVTAVDVKRGEDVVDSSGNLVTLDVGVSVYPSGCSDESCLVRYDGQSPLQMDQMIVTFRLLPDLKWSDGEPLTSADLVFAFNLASDAATPGAKFLVERTQTYEAVDERAVQWWGVPGYLDPTYADNVWMPLPEHLWKDVSAADLARGDIVAHPPVGWGPFVFREWAPGEYIRLEKNPNYFRAAEGLPKFTGLLFRFYKDAPTGISALIAGQCDILDTSLRLEGEIDLLTELERNEKVRLLTSTTPLIERLDLGIRPASYENADKTDDRPDLLGDVRTRQAINYCLDRPKVAATVLAGMSQIPDTFISPSHPLYSPEATQYEFDINKGIENLEAVGWTDPDSDSTTPRVASGIEGVADGTLLVLNYWTTSALQRRQVSEILSQSLAQCGIGVNLQYFSQDEFYAAGPDGILFGRKFDLAEYAVGYTGSEPPCAWFMSDQIPNKENSWLGLNVSGYDNADYDGVCRKAMRSLPDSADHASTYARVQAIFSNDLPSIPLYMRIKAAAARSDMCNFNLDAFSVNDLWNIEELDYGPLCTGQ